MPDSYFLLPLFSTLNYVLIHSFYSLLSILAVILLLFYFLTSYTTFILILLFYFIHGFLQLENIFKNIYKYKKRFRHNSSEKQQKIWRYHGNEWKKWLKRGKYVLKDHWKKENRNSRITHKKQKESIETRGMRKTDHNHKVQCLRSFV